MARNYTDVMVQAINSVGKECNGYSNLSVILLRKKIVVEQVST